MQRPPNLEVHVVLLLSAALSTMPDIAKHSRFCARAGSTWKSPPTITSNVIADANWQTTENSLRLHSWLENQYPLDNCYNVQQSDYVSNQASRHNSIVPKLGDKFLQPCSLRGQTKRISHDNCHTRSPAAVVVLVALQRMGKDGFPPSPSAPHPGLVAAVRWQMMFLHNTTEASVMESHDFAGHQLDELTVSTFSAHFAV